MCRLHIIVSPRFFEYQPRHRPAVATLQLQQRVKREEAFGPRPSLGQISLRHSRAGVIECLMFANYEAGLIWCTRPVLYTPRCWVKGTSPVLVRVWKNCLFDGEKFHIRRLRWIFIWRMKTIPTIEFRKLRRSFEVSIIKSYWVSSNGGNKTDWKPQRSKVTKTEIYNKDCRMQRLRSNYNENTKTATYKICKL